MAANPSKEELWGMLDKADKAGDTAGARDIYKWIEETPDEEPAPVAPVAAPVAPAPAKMSLPQKMDELKNFVNRPETNMGPAAFHGAQRASKGLLDTAGLIMGPYAAPFKTIHQALVETGMPSIYPTEQNLAAGEADVKKAGLPGALAAATTEAATGLPLSAGLTQAFTKAAPYVLPKAMQVGAPAIGELTGQAAGGAAMAPEGEKGRAALTSAAGTGIGSAVGQGFTGLVDLGKKGLRTYLPELMPGVKSATTRAGRALEEKYGPEEFNRMGGEIETQMGPHMLPQTTASLTNSLPAAAFERGARTRPTFKANQFDASVNQTKGDIFQNITQNAENVKKLEPVEKAIQANTQEALNKIPLNNKTADKITIGLDNLSKTEGFVAHPADAKAVTDWVNSVLVNKNTNIGTLHQLRTNLNEKNYNTEVLGPVRKMLQEVIDGASGGKLTATNIAAGQAKDKLKAAQSAEALRDQFTYAGKFKPQEITEKTLDTAVDVQAAKSAADKFPYIDESMIGGLKSLSEATKKHELYKTAQGASAIKPNEAEDVISAALDAGKGYQVRRIMSTVFGSYGRKTVEAADKAAADPLKFLDMVKAKRAEGKAIAEWEAKMERIVKNTSMFGGVTASEVSNEAGEQWQEIKRKK